MEGFIQLHKKICEWEWYTDIPTKTLFFHILLKCNYKEAKWRGIDVKPGDFITSIDHLSKETGLSIRQVRTALEHLETTGEVTKQSTSQYTILTLNNWGTYNTRDDKPTTNEGQTTDKPSTTTNKEYKEKKEYKENKETDTNVSSQAIIVEKTFGNEDINKTLAYISKAVGCTTFKETQKMQRIYGKHLFTLGKEIGIEEFNLRLKSILSDQFKAKNCNKLAYLYGELKSYIHSPIVEPTPKRFITSV